MNNWCNFEGLPFSLDFVTSFDDFSNYWLKLRKIRYDLLTRDMNYRIGLKYQNCNDLIFTIDALKNINLGVRAFSVKRLLICLNCIHIDNSLFVNFTSSIHRFIIGVFILTFFNLRYGLLNTKSYLQNLFCSQFGTYSIRILMIMCQ